MKIYFVLLKIILCPADFLFTKPEKACMIKKAERAVFVRSKLHFKGVFI